MLAHDAFHWSQMTSYRRCSWGYTKHFAPMSNWGTIYLLRDSSFNFKSPNTAPATTPGTPARVQAPSSHSSHCRAESRLFPSYRSPPQHIRHPVPTILTSASDTEYRNQRTDARATSTFTAQPRRCTRWVTNVDTGYVVAALPGARPYGSVW